MCGAGRPVTIAVSNVMQSPEAYSTFEKEK